MDINLQGSGFERAAELADWIKTNPERVEELKDTQELVKKKNRILTSFYKTGRIDGLYFGLASNSKRNHVKEYIKGCLYRNRINDFTLIDDCYNELFVHLQAMPAHKFCAMYDLAPAKVLATSLMIISLKCFAVDPRYGNPKHSLVQNILHAAAGGSNADIDIVENLTEGEELKSEYNPTPISRRDLNHLMDINVDPVEDFEEDFGFKLEDLIDRLTARERAIFYGAAGKQPRGKTSASVLAARAAVFVKLKKIKAELEKTFN